MGQWWESPTCTHTARGSLRQHEPEPKKSKVGERGCGGIREKLGVTTRAICPKHPQEERKLTPHDPKRQTRARTVPAIKPRRHRQTTAFCRCVHGMPFAMLNLLHTGNRATSSHLFRICDRSWPSSRIDTWTPTAGPAHVATPPQTSWALNFSPASLNGELRLVRLSAFYANFPESLFSELVKDIDTPRSGKVEALVLLQRVESIECSLRQLLDFQVACDSGRSDALG